MGVDTTRVSTPVKTEIMQPRSSLDLLREVVQRRYGADRCREGCECALKIEKLVRSFDNYSGTEVLARLAPELREFGGLYDRESHLDGTVHTIENLCRVGLAGVMLAELIEFLRQPPHVFTDVIAPATIATAVLFIYVKLPTRIVHRREGNPDSRINILGDDIFSRAMKAMGLRAWDFDLEED